MNTASPGKLRVVLDSDVYISAFLHSQGLPCLIWRRALARDYTLLVSPAIMTEVAGVLREKACWDDARLIRRLKLVAKVAEIIAPKISLQVVADDEPDNRILECAVAGKAHLVVSGDHHLTRLKVFQGIGIIRPIDLIRILGQ